MNWLQLSGPCLFQCWWSNINEFPSHLNPEVKYLHQTNCICLATLVTMLPYFSSICWGAVCLWKTGYKVGIIDHILCIIIFLFIICIAVELRTPSPDRSCWTRLGTVQMKSKEGSCSRALNLKVILKLSLMKFSSLFPNCCTVRRSWVIYSDFWPLQI